MDDKFNTIEEYLTFAFDFDQETRGSYLYQSAEIESLIEQIIAYHYCGDDVKKLNSFLSLVLSEINFNSKIRIFIKLLEKYPEFKRNFNVIKSSLENVRNFRNKLAHSKLDTSYKFIQQRHHKIRLIMHKDEKIQFLEITKKIMEQKYREIATLHIQLNGIGSVVSKGVIGMLHPMEQQHDSKKQEKPL